MSTKKVYSHMNQREHVLAKPNMYIGDSKKRNFEEWTFDEKSQKMIKTNMDYSKGLLKIFDEIISNAQDVYTRHEKRVKNVKVSVDNNTISVYNNGVVIPIEKMKDSDSYIISVMFGQMLSSSNYESDCGETIGTYGIGAKATNILSKKFSAEVYDKDIKTHFFQEWTENMSKCSDPVITNKNFKESYTKITFEPDLKFFDTDSLSEDIFDIFKKRCIDMAAVCNEMTVTFNNEDYKFKNIKEYFALYSEKDIISENGIDYDYCIIPDSLDTDQLSFVNGNFSRRGTHINEFISLIGNVIKEELDRKKLKTNTRINTYLKNKIFLFLNCKVIGPKFSSQSKEELVDGVLPKFEISKKIAKKIINSSIVQNFLKDIQIKEMKELVAVVNKKIPIRTITKLDDAEMAGTKEAYKCTLILTEGDSAKTMAICGLKIIGRKYNGVFPLKGKLINVRNSSRLKVSQNQEIKNIMNILGLNIKKKYDSISGLRYGNVMIMTDQDHDGSHIKGLFINFIHYFWPELLSLGFVSQFITPIVKVSKKNDVIQFYNMTEFENWYENEKNGNWNIKYYKGLGTSNDKEIEEYFRNGEKHILDFAYDKERDDKEIIKGFCKKEVESRKIWLQNMDPKNVLYNNNMNNDKISYADFINKELIHFSNADNIRSISSVIDGFKPVQRKVMFTLFDMNLGGKGRQEIKVEELSGITSSKTAYHHGADSIKKTIINMANNFVGSNNINLLSPNGQYGSRLAGGNDCSSPRYIFTNLEEIVKKIFIKDDENILEYNTEENKNIEPLYYIPIIPMILINGSRGLGTGWTTNIPCFNPLEIIDHLLKIKIKDCFIPWYKNFTGMTYKINNYVSILSGIINVNDEEKLIRISELPIGTWTNTFKERLSKDVSLEFKEMSTKERVLFEIKFNDDNVYDDLRNKKNGFYYYFKILTKIRTNKLVAFDTENKLKEYSSPLEIIKDFSKVRLDAYKKRKEFMIKFLIEKIKILSNKYRFIDQIIKEELVIFKRKIASVEKDLDNLGYYRNEEDNFDYLLKMTVNVFTLEKLSELKKKKEELEILLETTKNKSPEKMWEEELEELKKYIIDNTNNLKRVKFEKFTRLPFSKENVDIEKIEEVKIVNTDSDIEYSDEE